MRQYTTPTLTLTVEGHTLTEDIYVTFSDQFRQKIFTIKNPPMTTTEEGTEITVELTQEQTAKFATRSMIYVQVNWFTSNGKRVATDIAEVGVGENLLKEILSNE